MERRRFSSIIQHPPRAHTPPSPPGSFHPVKAEDLLSQQDDYIATELPRLSQANIQRALQEQERHAQTEGSSGDGERSPPSEATTAEDSVVTTNAHFRRNRYRLVRQTPKWYDGFVRMWEREVSVKVDARGKRDHLALERTYLGYLRTSVALSIAGVTVAQLFRLQHAYNPDLEFGFYVVGIPLAACFIGSAIVVVLLGAVRFWRQQRAIVRGKVWAGGWEINVVMGMSISLCLAMFAVVVGVDIKKQI